MSSATAPVGTLSPLGKKFTVGGSRWIRTNVRLGALNSSKPIQPVLKCHRVGYGSFRSGGNIRSASRMQSAAEICASAYDTRCRVAEVQTLPRKSASTRIVSLSGKEMTPLIDNGGSGFTGTKDKPYYRGGDGGGNGSGFPPHGEFPWGDFWFYLLLMLLWFTVRNIIQEGDCVYTFKDGRHKPITHFVRSANQAALEWKKFEEEILQRNYQ